MPSVNVVKEIITWVQGRKYWEQCLWFHLVTKGFLSQDDIQSVFQSLMEEEQLSPSSGAKAPVLFPESVTDVAADSAPLVLVEISNLTNVNAIPSDQSIRFSPNLTVIYGENGSGKSGYARLLKSACTYKGNPDPILANVFQPKPKDPTVKAKFTLRLGKAADSPAKVVEYSLGTPIPECQRFRVWDLASTTVHISENSSLSVLPANLDLFYKAASALDSLEGLLAQERAKRIKANPTLNRFEGTSDVTRFIDKLSKDTTVAEIELDPV